MRAPELTAAQPPEQREERPEGKREEDRPAAVMDHAVDHVRPVGDAKPG